ncbi:MAG: DsrE family protein [Spirochaetota bacterium]
MQDSVCMIIRRAPYGTIQAAEALRHINGAISGGQKTVVVLIEDGVYFAKKDQEAQGAGWTSLSAGVRQTMQGRYGDLVTFYLHDQSAFNRRIDTGDVLEGFKLVNSPEIAEIVGSAKTVMLF